MFSKRLVAMSLSVPAAMALGLTVAVSWAAPAAAQAQKSAQQLKAELDQLQIDMAALRARITAFRPPSDYCGPRQRLRAAHQAQMGDWEAEAERLRAASVVAARQFQDALRYQTGSAGRSGELADLNVYARERNKLMAAVAEKRRALDRALAVPCPGTTGSIQSGGGTIGTTGQGTKPQPPQPRQPPPLPQPPTYEPVTMPVLPKFFCSNEDRLAFLVSITAEMEKARDNAKKADMFSSSVAFAIFNLEQAGEPVPPGLRAQEQRADAEARAQQAQFDALHRLHEQAAATPVIDCSKPAASPQGVGTVPSATGAEEPRRQPNATPRAPAPATLQQRIRDAAEKHEKARIACDKEGMQAALAELEALLKEAEQLVRDVEALGGYGTISIEAARDARYAAEKALEVAKMRTPSDCPQPSSPMQDGRIGQAPSQQQTSRSVEAAIAELDELRRAGDCTEAWEAAEDLAERLYILGRRHVAVTGSSRQPIPPELIKKWNQQIDDIMKDCPQPRLAGPDRYQTPIPIFIPPPNSVEGRILGIHNQERAAVGARPLQWDSAMAASASAYAQQLAKGGPFVHAPRTGRENERENLSRGLPGASAEQMMVNWTGEKRNFTPGTYPNVSKTGNWYDVSHYTQMIWPTTTRVGCGTAGGSKYAVLVCRYTPPGNRDGSPVLAQNAETGRPDFPKLPMGGGMQQLDPPPPPRPTAAEDAPDGNEARHPLATMFAGALNRHYEAVRTCDREAAERALADMRYALDELRKRLKHARAVGGFSTVNPEELQRLIDGLERVLRGAEQRSQPGTCPPR